MDAVLTMTPRSSPSSSRRLMRSAASRMTLNVPIRLISMMRWKSSSGKAPCLPTVLIAFPVPAQLTTTRSSPSSAAASSAAPTASGSRTSPGANRVASPRSLATSSPDDPGRSAMTTLAPASTKFSTVARPRPEAPPVTRATWLLMSMLSNLSSMPNTGTRAGDQVRLQFDDGVLRIEINRPDSLNSVTADVLEDMADAVESAGTQDDVRVLVLSGAGRAFCSGADIGGGAELAEEGGPAATLDGASRLVA